MTGADMEDTVGIGTTSVWYIGAPGAEPPVLVGDENWQHSHNAHET